MRLRDWLLVGNLLCTLVFGVVGAIWAWRTTGPLAELERRAKVVDVRLAEAEAFTLEGQIMSPDIFYEHNNERVPLCPVLVDVRNTGKTDVQLTKVEFRVFVAPLGDVSKLSTRPPAKPVTAKVLQQVAESDAQSSVVGLIDPDSPNWVEQVGISKVIELKNGIVPAGQSRLERYHLISPIEMSVLTKVQVTVSSNKTSQTWYAFANPGMCRPGPLSADMGE